MDVCGRPAGALVLHDSNPGKISAVPGGVGRNIANDLALMGIEASLIAAVGDDVYGDSLIKSCAQRGIDSSMLRVCKGQSSSVYLYVTDHHGEMHVGVADMDITRKIDPDYLAPLMERINSCDAVVLDANLSVEALGYICDNCRVPIYADPVSTAKAGRFTTILGKIHTLKPNALEAERLTGRSDPSEAVRALLDQGVKRVFLSLGRDGIMAGEGREIVTVPCESVNVLNTNGAGDAVTAALVAAGARGLGLEEMAHAAVRAGAIVCSSEESNPATLSGAAVFGHRA